MRFSLAVVLACVAGLARADVALVDVALVDVHVVPMDRDIVLENHTILVRDGTIVAVAPALALPAGIEIIDGRGRYAMPGLMDMHVHVNDDGDELPLYLANGVTTVFSLHGNEQLLALRAALAAGERPGPRLFTCGPMARDVFEPDEGLAAAEAVAEKDYDCLKFYGDWDGEAFLQTAARARELDLLAIGHAPRNLDFAMVVESDVERLAHLEETVYTTPALDGWLDAYNDMEQLPDTPSDPESGLRDQVRVLAEKIRDAGIWIIPNNIVMESYMRRATDDFAAYVSRPYLQYLDPVRRFRWQRARTTDRLARHVQQFRLQQFMLGEFHAAGVNMALGTDASPGQGLSVMPGWSVAGELQLAVDAGLTPYEALRHATVNAAAFMEHENEGVLTAGARADILLLEANPLEDVANVRRIAGVLRHGEWWSRAELDALLDARLHSYAGLEKDVSALVQIMEDRGYDAAVQAFRAQDDWHPETGGFLESALNSEGYRLLLAGDTDAAIAVFELNTETFPDSANVWDSLAEAWLTAGDTDRARTLYQRALDVDPEFANARRMLEQLDEQP